MTDDDNTRPADPDASTEELGNPSSAALPKKIGPYRILEQIGEGGMGIVYLAEQTEPVQRRVALKIIKLGMDSKQVLARFEAERQALAMMDHPCVARVFDAGVSDDGRSYFVMEHVPGVPITEHCDRQRLSVNQRLNLFIQVCNAVQHAHQKGIIHRDLKPGNILVSAKEGSAVPKVIDFGVAKAMHQKLTEKTLFTEQGQLIGTPEYMSPEQAEMTGQDIDTRSDIYSLGVLLYELLTGALPFDPKSLREAAFGEIQRIIREVEPSKPSTKLSSLGDESTTSAEKRRLDPRSLSRELRGDLDWIVMKALEKDRERRYETANGLAMDIQRHLDYEPVLASPPSAAYRMRKFINRNKSAVVVSLASALVIALGVSALGVLLRMRYVAAEAELSSLRREEAAVFASLRAWPYLEQQELQRANSLVEQMSNRILAGKATTQDCYLYAQAMTTRIRVEGRSVQPVGKPQISLVAISSPITADSKGIGVLLRPRLRLNGVAAQWSPSEIRLSGFGGHFSIVIRLDHVLHAPGRYVLEGNLEARLVLTEKGISGESGSNLIDEYHDFLSETVYLPVSDFAFTVVEQIPETYPTLLRDESLAAGFARGVEVGPCVIIRRVNDHYEGRLEVRLPIAKMPMALELAIGRDGSSGWRESVGGIVLLYDHIVFGRGLWGSTFSVADGIGVKVNFRIPAEMVDGRTTAEEAHMWEVTIQSSRAVALAEAKINEYLHFETTKPVSCEIHESDKESEFE